MEVTIYIYQTIKGPGTKSGAYSYILETQIDEKIHTLTDIGLLENMSENKAELVTLLKALKRIIKDCTVQIIGQNDYVRIGCETRVDKWKDAEWKNAKGKEIANLEEWQQLIVYRDKYNIKFLDQKEHTYKNWMKTECEKKEREKNER